MKSWRKTRDASRRAVDLTALDTFTEVKRRVGVGFSERLEEADAVILLRQDPALLHSIAEFLGGTHRELEYGLITALAARARGNEEERRVSLFVVGDDDQNIYSFRGASVEYVRRFEEEYDAERVLLTSNYRSTGHIISASNALMAGVPERMKADVPIEIDGWQEESSGWRRLDVRSCDLWACAGA